MEKLSLPALVAICAVVVYGAVSDGYSSNYGNHSSSNSNGVLPVKYNVSVPLLQGNSNGSPGKSDSGEQANGKARMWRVKNYNNMRYKKENRDTLDVMMKQWISNKRAQNMTGEEKRILKYRIRDFIQKLKKNDNTKRRKRHIPALVIRKEFRRLTPQERKDFAAAVWATVKSGAFNMLIAMHTDKMAPGAHFGPAFLPWHRYFLRLFELTLQIHSGNSSMAIPYWNSGYEYTLGSYRNHSYNESSLFSDDMLGFRNSTGVVDNGLFANMKLQESCKKSNKTKGVYVTRDFKMRPWHFYTPYIGDTFKAYTHHANLSVPFNRSFETAHGYVHNTIGGTMIDVDCSPSEIMFWLHHSYVDYIWEQNRASRANGAYDYPTDKEIIKAKKRSPHHKKVKMIYQLGGAEMKPFSSRGVPLFNKDGVSDDILSMYTYEEHNDTCLTHADCRGDFWCNPFNKQCISKIQPGLWMFWDENGKPIVESVHCPSGKTPIAVPPKDCKTRSIGNTNDSNVHGPSGKTHIAVPSKDCKTRSIGNTNNSNVHGPSGKTPIAAPSKDCKTRSIRNTNDSNVNGPSGKTPITAPSKDCKPGSIGNTNVSNEHCPSGKTHIAVPSKDCKTRIIGNTNDSNVHCPSGKIPFFALSLDCRSIGKCV